MPTAAPDRPDIFDVPKQGVPNPPGESFNRGYEMGVNEERTRLVSWLRESDLPDEARYVEQGLHDGITEHVVAPSPGRTDAKAEELAGLLDSLEVLAGRMPPGRRWEIVHTISGCNYSVRFSEVDDSSDMSREEAEYFAALDPATVLRLVAAVRCAQPPGPGAVPDVCPKCVDCEGPLLSTTEKEMHLCGRCLSTDLPTKFDVSNNPTPDGGAAYREAAAWIREWAERVRTENRPCSAVNELRYVADVIEAGPPFTLADAKTVPAPEGLHQ